MKKKLTVLIYYCKHTSLYIAIFTKMESAISPEYTIILANDTLQKLNYATRPAFNALWEPKDMVSIDVKAIERRRILGDEYLETVIKERPRTYMMPSVSLDDVEDRNERNLLIDFTYKTIQTQAAKEVWDDFEIRSPCLLKRHIEKQKKPLIDPRAISRLSTKFQGAAREWDYRQIRSLFDKKVQKLDRPDADKEMLEKEQIIRKLICEDKLNIFYDKLPPSYTGFRPHVAHGVPLEKKETCGLLKKQNVF